jgi:hypothetical protein
LDGDREANLDILYDGCLGMRRMSQHTPAGFSMEFLIGKTEMNPTLLQNVPKEKDQRAYHASVCTRFVSVGSEGLDASSFSDGS